MQQHLTHALHTWLSDSLQAIACTPTVRGPYLEEAPIVGKALPRLTASEALIQDAT